MNIEHILLSVSVVTACVFVLWLLSVKLRDASIADIWWGPGFAVIAGIGWMGSIAPSNRYALVTFVVTAWGLRLGLYLAHRNLGHDEDRRYQAMRGNSPHFWWTSLFKVFLLQGGIQIIVALPIFAAAHSQTAINMMDIAGASIALAGVMIEAVADHQLARFKSLESNEGLVMDNGLWGYSRHPNYFGNAVLWCGIGIIGLSAGGPWWCILGPVLMIFLLLKVSGVSMLESTITDRRPAYQQYKNEVSAFIPWPRAS